MDATQFIKEHGVERAREEIMSFQYFTGCSFIDHKDAMEQYAEYLEANERGAWLP